MLPLVFENVLLATPCVLNVTLPEPVKVTRLAEVQVWPLASVPGMIVVSVLPVAVDVPDNVWPAAIACGYVVYGDVVAIDDPTAVDVLGK